MRLLVVKTSSLGDVVHCLPAVTDALRARPVLEIDWVVERPFTAILAQHPGIRRVLPIALRAWRRTPWKSRQALKAFVRTLREQRYDLILDAQGLIKSAIVARAARGALRAGFDARSVREWPAAVCYHRRIAVARDQHAIARQRQLFAAALGYAFCGEPDFGLSPPARPGLAPAVVLLHGTSARHKEWPVAHWIDMARRARAAGYAVVLPSGNAHEFERATAIAAAAPGSTAPAPEPLSDVIDLLAGACGVVTVDTGLGQLAAALGVPAVGLFGPSRVALTGLSGPWTENLASPLPCRADGVGACRVCSAHDAACMASLGPEHAWSKLEQLIAARRGAAARGA
jgi:heptosyltransferase I